MEVRKRKAAGYLSRFVTCLFASGQMLNFFKVTSSAQAMEPIGVNKFEPTPKSGFVKFEFDKDWLGAKG